MKIRVKKAGRYLLEKLNLYSLYELKKYGYLHDVGWLRSYREQQSIDSGGNPIPWITYPAISFLEQRVASEATVFEYGCGNSTLWWAKRVRSVISYEHDKRWYDRMKRLVPPNVELRYIELEYDGEYARAASQYKGAFDVIVIDGRDRVNCAKNALGALNAHGVIVWDNSDRVEYEEGYKYLYSHGFKKLGFVGMAPIVSYTSETALFYTEQNVLGI